MGHEILTKMPRDRQRFIKSHLPWEMLPEDISETNPKIIYVARNPKGERIAKLKAAKTAPITRAPGH